jgi:hypothetical protein
MSGKKIIVAFVFLTVLVNAGSYILCDEGGMAQDGFAYIAFKLEPWHDEFDDISPTLDLLSIACGKEMLQLKNLQWAENGKNFYLLRLSPGRQKLSINVYKTIEYVGHKQVAIYVAEKYISVPSEEVIICWIDLYSFATRYICRDHEAAWCETRGSTHDIYIDEDYRFSDVESFYTWAIANDYEVVSNVR